VQRINNLSNTYTMAKYSTKENRLQINSDGSDFKGTGKIGFGFVAKVDGKLYKYSGTEKSPVVLKLAELYPDATFSNPTMEMTALLMALSEFRQTSEHLLIIQDYKGAVCYDGLWQFSDGSEQRSDKPWKAKEPYIALLVQRAKEIAQRITIQGGSVEIRWIKGHTGDEMNDLADKAAKDRDEYNTFTELLN